MKCPQTDDVQRGENALTWLNLALDTDFDMLDEDDFYDMPPERVHELLDRHGGPGATPAEDGPDDEKNTMPNAWRTRDDNAWIVPRPAFTEDVLDSLARGTVTVVAGPVGRGRSTWWRQELRHHPDFRRTYWPHVYLDCCALRSRSVERFEEEALRTLLIHDDDYRLFIAGLGTRAARPLEAWLTERLYRDAGTIVLDHAECLALHGGGEMVNRMRALVDFCDRRCIKLLVLWSGVFDATARRAFRRPPTPEQDAVEPAVLHMPLIEADEIGNWWNRPVFATSRQAGLDAARVHHLTGGVTRLLRDFGRFVEDRMEGGGDLGVAMAEEFCAISAREYAPEIERALMVARRRPILLDHPERAARYGLGDAMMATGAFRELGGADAAFVSPILRERFRACVKRRGLQTILHRGTISETLSRRQLQEIGATDLADLLFRMEPDKVLKALDAILRALCDGQQIGLNRLVASVAHRDPMNERLWSNGQKLKGRDPETWPLNAGHDPDFSKAVRRARPVERADGRLLVPVLAGRGRVGAVLTLDMAAIPDHPTQPAFRRRLLLRTLWRMVQTLQPALAQALRNHDAQRERHAYRHALYKRGTPHTIHELLRRLGCQAVLQMRRTSLGWIVEGIDAMPDQSEGQRTVEGVLFEHNDTGRLDAIGDHDAERPLPSGLVLEPRELRGLFAHVTWRDDERVFAIRGIARDRLHLYLFNGRDAHRIDGFRQAELTRFTWERDLLAARG